MDGSDRRLFTEDHGDTGFYPGIFGISDKQTSDVGDEVIHEAETLPALPRGETMHSGPPNAPTATGQASRFPRRIDPVAGGWLAGPRLWR
jgi:hypothetical protein